ncbi:DUF4189 domain-containing protein [Luteibacter aegosomaticola]|uniref:DUF4189 domain-containing protein n=1 Tax=Luteibacter aegosomaticola TaxID=2911538 RepID=UPI001FFB44C2|nr:DUF4189 domain-containing protein [Luteibacter aegosomaticola]UPG90841.1 DUF4189 domain-containing protein [Luteibacter aegosomaticola]
MSSRNARFLALMLALPLTFFATRSHAQTYPCSGPGPGRVVVGIAPGGQGIAQTPICQDTGDGYAEAPVQQAPTRYMSVVVHPDTDKYWFARGFRSGDAATASAMKACTQAMGDGCSYADGWYGGSRIVVMEDVAGNLFVKGGNNFFSAWGAARSDCEKYSTGCHKLETLTNDFSDGGGGEEVQGPKGEVTRRLWGALARPKTKAPEPLDDLAWLATGQDGYKAAESAALNACHEATKLDCEVRISVGGGYIARIVNNTGNVYWFNASSLEMLDKGLKNACAKGDTCRLVDTFDVKPRAVTTVEISVSKAPIRGYFSLARPEDDQVEKRWSKRAVASGQATVLEAQAAAVALCEKESGSKCVANPKDGDDGVDQFVLMVRASTGEYFNFWGTSAQSARERGKSICEEKHLQCGEGTLYDLAKKNKGSLISF